MKSKLVMVVRVFLGLLFTVFGLNGFFHFLPMPPMSGTIGEMMGVYQKLGYMFPLIFATQLVSGILLLMNRWVALALLFLAPVIVNILFLHLFIDPAGMPMALIVTAAEIFLLYAYREKYQPVLKAK